MTPLLDQPGLAIFECPGLIVILMRSSPDDAAFNESGARVREVLTRQSRINVLILIPNFDGKARASRATQTAFVKLLGDMHPRLVGACITITVPGLKGTMLRVMVNGLLMLGRLRIPIQLHASVPATLAWLKSLPGQVPGVLDAPNLAQDLERLLPAR